MVNRVILQGRLTADPELKETQSGIKYLESTVAWNEKYKETETVCFLRCKAWRHTAEFIANYFHKGDQLIIEGRMVTESWTDSEGQNKSRTICSVDRVNFCGSSSRSEKPAAEAGNVDKWVPVLPGDSDEDELPFV